jgi:RND family efflux transporter MFP subunit
MNGARQGFGAVEGMQAGLAAAQAQLAQAEKALADTTIRAPFDGNITARPVAAGEYVALTNKIATIVRMGSLKLQLQTPEQRASRAKVGMPVTARVSAYPEREFSGKVTAINDSVDPSSRVFIVEARFENGKGELRPGMFATARVQLPGGETAVFVPKNAIWRDKTTDTNQIFVVENGKARLRVVVVGDSDGDQVRIASGLGGNEKVAVNHLNELFDGAAVESHN